MKKILKKILTNLTYMVIKDDLENAVLMNGKGDFFKPFSPECPIDLEVIALALSRLKRFFGQTDYSVAQHSVLLAKYFLERGDIERSRQALLHEASEGFVGDMVTPIKKAFPLFKTIENSILEKVFACCDVSYPISEEVDKADKRLMVDEAMVLMPNECYWRSLNEPLGIKIEVWSQEKSFQEFMKMANMLFSIKSCNQKYLYVESNQGTAVCHPVNAHVDLDEVGETFLHRPDVVGYAYFGNGKKLSDEKFELLKELSVGAYIGISARYGCDELLEEFGVTKRELELYDELTRGD